jgi:hypothetical protein
VLTTKLIHSMRRDGLKRAWSLCASAGDMAIALAIETLRRAARK